MRYKHGLWDVYLCIVLCFFMYGGSAMAFEIQSPSFRDNEFIPHTYTCKDKDISPPLNWSGIPAGTKSLVLMCTDPDAPGGTWVHWLVYDLAPDVTGLPEAVPKKIELNGGAKQGMTDFRAIGYGGPCPPPGKVHRYVFTVYALDAVLNAPAGLNRNDLVKRMKGRIIGEATLTGLYSR